MDWMECFDAFYFDDDEVFDQQIDAVTEFDFFAVIDYRQTDLAAEDKAAFFQFVSEASLVCAFQKARPKQGMDVHRGGNDGACDLVDAKIGEGSCRCHSYCITQLV
jgi:hypothetical protein